MSVHVCIPLCISRLCNEKKPCPLPIVWTAWGPWAHCSADCGGGVHSRTRSCENGNSCPGCATVFLLYMWREESKQNIIQVDLQTWVTYLSVFITQQDKGRLFSPQVPQIVQQVHTVPALSAQSQSATLGGKICLSVHIIGHFIRYTFELWSPAIFWKQLGNLIQPSLSALLFYFYKLSTFFFILYCQNYLFILTNNTYTYFFEGKVKVSWCREKLSEHYPIKGLEVLLH